MMVDRDHLERACDGGHRTARLLVLVLLFALGLTACASLRPPVQVEDVPRVGPAAGRPAVALVRSGGSARGFAHIGVVKVLQEASIEPNLIVGASAGNAVAAAYAAGMDAQQLAEGARSINSSMLHDITVPNMGQPIVRGELGLVRGERLQMFVDRLVGGRRMKDLPRRVAVVATDLQTGKRPQMKTSRQSLPRLLVVKDAAASAPSHRAPRCALGVSRSELEPGPPSP